MAQNSEDVKQRWARLKRCIDWFVECKMGLTSWADTHARLGWWIAFWGLLNIVVTLVK